MGSYSNDEINDNITGKRKIKESRRAKRPGNISRLLGRIVALSFLAAAVFFAAMSPFFNVTRINVSGNERYEGQVIIDASGIVAGVNLFRINSGNAAAQIRNKCPYIDTASVNRTLPSTITLKVTERKPFGKIVKDGYMIVIDSTGHVLEVTTEGNSLDIPRLIGLDFAGYEAGKRLSLDEPGKLQQILDLTGILSREDMYSRVTMMDATFGLSKVNFELDGRIIVKMGMDKNVSYKFSLLKEILSKSINKDEKGTLEISENGKANYTPSR